jgi:hypothetical protein
MIDQAEVIAEEVTVVETAVVETPFPADLEFKATKNNWTPEQRHEAATKYYEANPDKKVPPKKEEIVVKETPAAAAVVETPIAGTPATEAAAPVVTEYPDDIKAAIAEAKEYREKKAEMEAAYTEFLKDKEVVSRAKNPIPEVFQKEVSFFNATGIADREISSKILSINKDSDPLDIQTAAFLLENPEYSTKGWAATYKQIARENGVNLSEAREDWEEGVKEALEFKSVKPLKNILEKTEKLSSSQDFYASLQQEYEQVQEQKKSNLEAWKTPLGSIASQFTQGETLKFKSDKYGDINLSIAGSKEEVTEILKSMSDFVSEVNPDEKGINLIKNVISQRLRTNERIQKAVEKLLDDKYATLESKATEAALKKTHNGGPTHIDKTDAPKGAGDYDAFKAKYGKG